MFYTSAWCLDNEKKFNKNIPLLLLGDSIIKHNSASKLIILFLEGYNKISKEYIRKLAEKKIEIVDYTNEFSLIVNRYPHIKNRYSHYERNCFLRWIAFNEYRKKNDTEQFWHIDSDVVLHMSIDEIKVETKGLTFMTLGCPVFLTVSDYLWFEIYQTELSKLDKNISGYLNEGGMTKAQCKTNDHAKFNVSLYREPIGSDQDLLEYLVSSNKIIQSDYKKIIDSNLYYVQNPLMFSMMSKYLPKQSPAEKITNDANDHLIYLNKKIPFIHFQGTFCFYLANMYLTLKKIKLNYDWLLDIFLKYEIKNDVFHTPLLPKIFLKMCQLLKISNFSRNDIISLLINTEKEGVLELTNLLNLIVNIEQNR